MTETLIYLQEKGLDDYAVLKEKASSATARFNDLNDKIKTADNRMNEIAALQKHTETTAGPGKSMFSTGNPGTARNSMTPTPPILF